MRGILQHSFTVSALFMSLFALAGMALGCAGTEGFALGAIGSFIPQVWSARLLREFRRARYWRRAITDVSDEIARQGDQIHLGEVISEPTIRDYNKNVDIADPEIQADYEDSLHINQGKYFNVGVNDVDRIQSKPELLPRFTSKAGYKLALEWDGFIRAVFNGDVEDGTQGTYSANVGPASGRFGSSGASLNPSSLTGKAKPSAAANSLRRQRAIIQGVKKNGPQDYASLDTGNDSYLAACVRLVEQELFPLRRILAARKWPTIIDGDGGESGAGGGERPYAIANLKTIEAVTFYLLKKFGSQGTGRIADEIIVQGGLMREILGFDLIPDAGMSNDDPKDLTGFTKADGSVGYPQICIGMRAGIYSAEQIRETEAYRPEARFQDAVKGLSVYGAKRVDGTMLFAVVQGEDGRDTDESLTANKRVVGRYDYRGVDNQTGAAT